MNLQHLQYIVEIANCGSISGAARRLFVSQPYLSRILQEVEDEYQITIFSRSKSGIALTDNGQFFVDMAKNLTENARLFERTFSDRTESFRLRVASCAISHSVDAFIRMLKEFPEYSLRFSYRECTNSEVIDSVYTNSADIGILLTAEESLETELRILQLRRLEYHELFRMETCLVVREGHPILSLGRPPVMEDLYRYNFVLYPQAQNNVSGTSERLYEDSAVGFFDWNRVRQIVTVHNRSALHNILTLTDFIGLGTLSSRELNQNFHIVPLPLPADAPYAKESKNRYVLGYILSKSRKPPEMTRAYLSFLETPS